MQIVEWLLAACAMAIILVAPGYALARWMREDRDVALALAPAISVTLITGAGIVFSLAGISWWPPTVVGILAAVACFAGWRARRWARARARLTCPAWAVGAWGGGALASIVMLAVYWRGTGGFSRFPQTYDAPFHFNSIVRIVETGDASILHMGRLVGGGYYPGGWHNVVSLVAYYLPAMEATHVAVVVVFALTACASAITAHRLVPGSVAAPACAAIASACFAAFPYRLAAYGTLYPNLFAYVLMAGVVAHLVSLPPRVRAGDAGLRAWIMLGMGVCGIACAHPNGVFGFLFFLVPALVAISLSWLGAQRPRGWDAVVSLVWPLGMLAAGYLASQSVIVRSVATWEPRFTLNEFSWGKLLLSVLTDTQFTWERGYVDTGWWLAGGAAIGLIVLAGRSRQRWFLACAVCVVAFFAVSMRDVPVLHAFAKLWYFDQIRIGSLSPVALAPLVGIGVGAVADWGATLVARRWTRTKPILAVALAGVIFALLIPVTDKLHVGTARQDIFYSYWISDRIGENDNSLYDTHEIDFQRRLDDVLPDESLVLANPYTGAVSLPALSDNKVVFPHFNGKWSADEQTLGESFNRIGEDPQVCQALERLGVDYFYWDPQIFWVENGLYLSYPGLIYTRELEPYLTPVASSGKVKVWRITGCR